jgi:adenosylcobyric acid synthase
VPFDLDLAIPEEDSVALGRKGAEPDPGDDRLKVGVIRLPHISNYTDFDPLEQEPGVALRYLSQRDSLEGLELVILPGTKNTIGDLLYLKETGLWGRIKAHAGGGGRVVGICGGYQMLGEEVRDPLGVEGEPRTEPGLGLLPVVTTMAGDKTTTQVRGKARGIPGEGAGVEGYEIHMGVTEIRGPGQPAFQIERLSGETLEAADGWVHPEGRVWGTYLHGVFDGDEFRRAFLQELRQGLGKFCRVGTAHQNFPAGSAPLTENFSFREFQEEQLDRLADLFREHVDLGRIWKMIRS